MKFPQAPQFPINTSKPPDSLPSPTAAFATNLFYEPTSVLDPHLTSSPAPAVGDGDLPPLPWDILTHAPLPPPSDDWDPAAAAWFLSEKDDLSPPIKPQFYCPEDPPPPFIIPDLPFLLTDQSEQIHQSPPPLPLPPNFSRVHLELLIRAAHSAELGDLQTALVILARLNQHLPAPAGGSLQRAVFHFSDALISLLPVPDPPSAEPPLSAVELVRRVAAHKAFSDLSPIPQFAGFTTNQTLLESLQSAPAIHLIDFDLGLGGQWSSFVQEIASRSRASGRPSPPVRITAVLPEVSVEATLAAENLRDFARGLGVRLAVDFARIGSLGALALGGVRLSSSGFGEASAVVLTPAIFRLLGSTPESAAALLRFVRRASPRIVVFVDTEPCGASGVHPPSFLRSFAAALELYAAVLGSLDATVAANGAGDELVRRIERSVIRPRVFASVGSCGIRSTTWQETFLGAGMAPVPFSEFTESQAEWLMRRAPVDGYHVARKEGSMVLSWRGRELAATSAWRY